MPDSPLRKQRTILPQLPALWESYIALPGAPRLPVRLDPDVDVVSGRCVALGCAKRGSEGRHLCKRCYRRAQQQGVLGHFPRKGEAGRLPPGNLQPLKGGREE